MSSVDALAQSWHLEDNWLHPPPDLLLQVASRLEREPQIHGTLVTPYWPAEPWFQIMRQLSTRALVLPVASQLV